MDIKTRIGGQAQVPRRGQVTDQGQKGTQAFVKGFIPLAEMFGYINFLRSATSDSLGFCVDHSKYLYDSDGDNTPDTPLPACATLPDGFGSGSAFGAADLGCVDSSHATGLATGKLTRRRVVDDLRPLVSRDFSERPRH